MVCSRLVVIWWLPFVDEPSWQAELDESYTVGAFLGSVVAVVLRSGQGKPGLPVWISMGYPFGLVDRVRLRIETNSRFR